MRVRWLGARALEAALPITEAVAAVADAYRAVAAGRVQMPLRLQLNTTDGVSLFMPSSAPELGRTALKVVSVYPGNAARGLPAILGLALLLDAGDGRPLAVLEAATLTALRTGAASGVAARALAREDAAVLAMLGAGAQAAPTVRAVCAVRPIAQVRVWSRTAERARQLVERLRPTLPGVEWVVTDSPVSAVTGADVVCTATPAREPLFPAEAVAPGALVSAVGSFRPEMRELPLELLQPGRVFVDQRQAACEESGEIVEAIASGRLRPEQLTELGAVLAGQAAGRRHGHDVLVFKSVGLAAQDLFAAARALARAEAEGLGEVLSLA